MAQYRFDEDKSKNAMFMAALNLGAFILVVSSIYIVKTLSILYGIGIGAIIQSSYTGNVPLAPLVQQAALNIGLIHQGILESYAMFLVAFGAMIVSFMFFIRRTEKTSETIKKYSLLHAALVVMFLLLLFVLLSDFYTNLDSNYLFFPYAGIAISLAGDAYMQYIIRKPSEGRQPQMKHTIAINPDTPFSNVINLQDQLFSNMSGHLKIVDKHFNSVALANLHRLIENSVSNFTKISVLTSKEMLDSKFNESVSDFRAQLGPSIGVEIRVMDDKDAVEQHERILMDDRIAYKIPPFNIITKRSEHITKINYNDANKRFAALGGRAIKMENYAIKKGRDNPQTPPSTQTPQPPQ